MTVLMYPSPMYPFIPAYHPCSPQHAIQGHHHGEAQGEHQHAEVGVGAGLGFGDEHLRVESKPGALPNDLNAVTVHFAIRSDQRQFFKDRLADDQAVKRIAMILETGQIPNQIDVLDLCLEYVDAELAASGSKLLGGCLIDAELSDLLLDHDFPKRSDAHGQLRVAFKDRAGLA